MGTEGTNSLSPASETWPGFELQGVVRRDPLGTTKRALDLKTGLKVDLRVLPDWTDLPGLKQFIDRIKTLSHPALIPTLDLLVDGTNSAVLLEFCDGETIPQRRSRRPRRHFEISEVKPWLRTMVDLLGYLHREDLPHGAVSLGSFLIENGSVRMADLAISRLLRPQSHFEGGAFLSLAVMSPQMMAGNPPSKSDDVYALAALAYDLLTGSALFHSGDIGVQVNNSIPPSIQERREQMETAANPISQEWEMWFAAALSKDSSKRPALETLAALVRPGAAGPKTISNPPTSLQSEPVKSVLPHEPEQMSEPVTGHFLHRRWIAVAAGACTIFFLGFYFFKIAPENDFRRRLNMDYAASFDYDQQHPQAHEKVIERWDAFSTKWRVDVQQRNPKFQPVLSAADRQRDLREEMQRREAAEIAKKLADHVARVHHEFIDARTAAAKSALVNPAAALQTWEQFLAAFDQPFEGRDVPGELATDLAQARLARDQLKSSLDATQKQLENAIAAAVADLEKLRTVLADPTIPASGKTARAETFLTELSKLPGEVAKDPHVAEMRQEITGLLPSLKLDTPVQTPTDPLDLKALFGSSIYQNFSNYGQRKILKNIQTTLKDLGFYQGNPDGDPGSGTHQAIIAYQISKNLAPSAALDEPTLTALGLTTFTDTFAGREEDEEAPARKSRRSPQKKPERNLFQKTGDSAKKFGRSIGNLFR